MKCSFEEYREKAQQIHGTKYKYLKEDFDESNFVTYICPKGNKHRQRKQDHLKGKGCFCCRKPKNKLSTSAIIQKANEIHQNKFDYSLLKETSNCREKVDVICHKKDRYGIEHGKFTIQLQSHLYGKCGCPKCAQEKRGFKAQITKEIFIERAKEKHKDIYVYDENLNFKNSRENVNILCPKHGYFTQNAHAHLSGQGCPHCNSSKLENTVKDILTESNIDYCYQQRFDWLGKLSLDFYLPQYNIAIECQGEQHFKPHPFFGGTKAFNKQVERDTVKRDLCAQNGIKLLYFAKKAFEKDVLTQKEQLIDKIKEKENIQEA